MYVCVCAYKKLNWNRNISEKIAFSMVTDVEYTR